MPSRQDPPAGPTGQELILGRAVPDIENSPETAMKIAQDILGANSLDDLFKSRATVATKDIIGKPIRVLDVRLLQSQLEGRETGTFMLIDAVNLETGEMITVNTGAKNIMAMLWRAKELGKLPLEVEVIQVGRGKRGQNAPLGLRPHGETAKAIEAAQS